MALSKDHRSPRGLARLLNHDHLLATVFSKIAAWAKVAKKKEFGVTKTDEEWCRDLEVTPKQFRRAKELLVSLGLVEKTRAPWGKRPNALFLKLTPLGERILETTPMWAPSSRPNRQVMLNIGPDGQVAYPLYCPNGPFLYPIKTTSKKNESNKETDLSAHAHAWSHMPPEEFNKLIEQEDVSELREIEIETVPRLIAFWDMTYCTEQRTKVSPPWLPGHVRILEQLIKDKIEEYLSSAIESDAKLEALAKEQDEDEEGTVEKHFLENNQDIDPDTFRAEIRDEVVQDVCRKLAITFSWVVPNWLEFIEWIKKTVGTKDVPEVPELEFLLYYSALAERWAMANELSNSSDEEYVEEYVKDCLHREKDKFEKREAEYHEVAAKHHPDYIKEPWTLEQYVPVIMGAGIRIAIMAARHWTKWRELQGDKADIKPFSTDAMIEELDEFATWAVDLWNPEGGHKIEGMDEDVAIMLPTPSKENDYWPHYPETLGGQEVVSSD